MMVSGDEWFGAVDSGILDVKVGEYRVDRRTPLH